MTPEERLAGHIMRERRAAGLTQAELGALCGMPQPTMQKLETGKRPIRYNEAVLIASLLGLQLDDMLDTAKARRVRRLKAERLENQIAKLSEELKAVR